MDAGRQGKGGHSGGTTLMATQRVAMLRQHRRGGGELGPDLGGFGRTSGAWGRGRTTASWHQLVQVLQRYGGTRYAFESFRA